MKVMFVVTVETLDPSLTKLDTERALNAAVQDSNLLLDGEMYIDILGDGEGIILES